ncbi:MAG: hypothetical protein LBS68_03250 [Puniceicoccales bacterium]|jgi:hypothetical protein|nr:hypothetical protein [Puniceicoccales bacterium]
MDVHGLNHLHYDSSSQGSEEGCLSKLSELGAGDEAARLQLNAGSFDFLNARQRGAVIEALNMSEKLSGGENKAVDLRKAITDYGNAGSADNAAQFSKALKDEYYFLQSELGKAKPDPKTTSHILRTLAELCSIASSLSERCPEDDNANQLAEENKDALQSLMQAKMPTMPPLMDKAGAIEWKKLNPGIPIYEITYDKDGKIQYREMKLNKEETDFEVKEEGNTTVGIRNFITTTQETLEKITEWFKNLLGKTNYIPTNNEINVHAQLESLGGSLASDNDAMKKLKKLIGMLHDPKLKTSPMQENDVNKPIWELVDQIQKSGQGDDDQVSRACEALKAMYPYDNENVVTV